jgi:hypothetical protein
VIAETVDDQHADRFDHLLASGLMAGKKEE